MYQALYRKWRPKSFDDVVGQPHITRTLKRQIMTDHLSHAYLFTGTRGTGKTTCAKLMAKAVNCEHPIEGNPCGKCPSCLGIDSGSILDVVELDAASNNGVDQVRALRDEAVYSPAAVRRRVYIIDEVHMLSVGAFNALLKILEEPPEHVVFILATTELHKVPATILSRCQRFSFKRIQAADIQNRLLYIAQSEGIHLTEDGASLLARLADGALRDALSLLDQCAVSDGVVDRDAVLDALGLAGNTKTAHIMNYVRRGETAKALTELSDLYAAGKDVGAVLSELSGLTRDLLLRITAGDSTAGLMTGGYDEATMQALSRGFTPQRLLHMLTLLQDTQAKLKSSVNRRTDAELCLIRLCDRQLDGSVLSLSQRISRIEAALTSGTVPTDMTAAQGEENARPFVGGLPREGEEVPLQDGEVSVPGEEPLIPPLESTEEPVSPPEPVQETPLPQLELEKIATARPAMQPVPQPEQVQSPPAPIPRPAAPRVSRREAGRRSRQNAGGTGDLRFWQELAPTLSSASVGQMAFAFISKQLVSGEFDGGILTLYTIDEGAKQWLSNEMPRRGIETAATAKAGHPVRVIVEAGKPKSAASTASAAAQTANSAPFVPDAPEKSGEIETMDPLKELLSFAQTVGKGIVAID